jgi:hypothetical protein
MSPRVNSRFMDIYQTPRTRNNWRLATKELDKRAGSLYRMVSYAAAKSLYDSVLASLPGGSDYADLRNGLKVEEVEAGKKGKSAAFAVHVSPRAKRVRKVDLGKTVIYVRVVRKNDTSARDIQILEDNGPWTPDTIPFWPKKSQALVIQRKVSKREADQISEMKKPGLDKVIRQLNEVGRKVKKPQFGKAGTVGRKGKAVPDVSLLAQSLEFGQQGRRGKPVWRRALADLRSSGIKRLPDRFKEIDNALHDPNSRRWKSWPPKGRTIPSSRARSFVPFQKRLGYGK